MPSSKVYELYESYLKQGYAKKDAAKEAQKRTDFSLVTGKPIKKGNNPTRKRKYVKR